MQWEIEKLKESIIDSDVRFTTNYMSIREIHEFRKDKLLITCISWITLRAISSDGCMTVYNPSTLILIFKN